MVSLLEIGGTEMKRLLFAAIMMCVTISAKGQPALVFTAVRNAVETYANVEYELGDPAKREKIIQFSPKFEAKIQKDNPGEWVYVGFGYYDRIVVSSYKVGDIKIEGLRATAQVIYRRLAHAEGDTDDTWHIIAEPPHDETVTLNLVFDKNQWWVLDPPPPRVSKKVLLEYYEATIKRLRENGWLTQPNLSSNQKAAFDKDVENLRILKSLP